MHSFFLNLFSGKRRFAGAKQKLFTMVFVYNEVYKIECLLNKKQIISMHYSLFITPVIFRQRSSFHVNSSPYFSLKTNG